MAEEKRTKNSKHPFRKKVVRGLMLGVLAVLFLEFVVYFGANFLLASWVRTKINEASKDIYDVDFNQVRFSLFRRGVFLDGIVMKPVEGLSSDQDRTLFDISLDQLGFKNLWFDFSEEVLYVGNVEFDNPSINMILPDLPDSVLENRPKRDLSQVKELEEELQKIISRANFTGVYINEVLIDNADLFFLNFLSHNSLKAENTKLVIKDINWTTSQDWETPFNARGFEFNLERVDFPLPDGVHAIHSDKVYISSLENIIDLEGFQLYPDKSQPSKAYYSLALKDLRVGNVDLNKAFMSSDVLIDEIVLNQPDFKVEKTEAGIRDSTATGDLNEMIQGILKSFEVKELSINAGKFVSANSADSLKNRIDIKKFDFKMIEFYLGQDESKRSNQFFYGQDASMEIQNADLYLSDGIHVISGEKVSLSSFKDELLIENVNMAPREGILAQVEPDNILRVSLPMLVLNEANLKKLYNQGVFDVQEMLVQSPKLEMTELKSSGNSSQNKLQAVLEGYLDEIAIQTVRLEEGEIQFTNDQGERSDDIGFEKFSLLLENVSIYPNVKTTLSERFLADEMVLSLDKYRLKLRDNLHEFMADRIVIDSKNSRVLINDFVLRPENPDSIQYSLDTYGKSVVLNVEIPEFRIEGIDLMAAYMDNKLLINQVTVPAPKANYTRYRKNNRSKSATHVESSGEIKDLLTAYFSYIQIDSVSFSDGAISYTNYSGPKEITFSEDSLTLNLKGFFLAENVQRTQAGTFFSDEIDLILAQYNFSVAGGSYNVDTDGIRYNSKSQSIHLDNITLSPSASLKSKIGLSLSLPSVALEGVDIESFLFENKLELDKLLVEGSSIGLEIRPEFEQVAERKKSKILEGNALPKAIERIAIDTIESSNSSLSLNYKVGDDDFESIQTDFDLAITGFDLDSTANAREDIAGLFDQISLSLQDFSYALPDSVHVLKFSSLYVDNTAEETVFSEVEVVPRNTTGQLGKPVFSGSIDQLGVRNNTIQNIQQTGKVDFSGIRLTNPKIEVYLPQEGEISEKVKKAKPEVKSETGLIEAVLLQDLLVQNGSISVRTKEGAQIPKLNFNHVNFGLQDLNLNVLDMEQEVGPEFLIDKDLNLSVSNYHILTSDSMNRIRVGKIVYLDKNLILDSISVEPAMGRYEFLRKKGYQDNAIDAFVSRATVEGINFDEYFENQNLRASALRIDGLQMDVFRDKRIPLKEGIVKPMPQELLEKAFFDVTIDSLLVNGSKIRYQEFGPKSMIPGSIYFGNVSASLVPFVMRKAGEDYPVDFSTLQADAAIMGEGAISLNAKMYSDDPYPMDVHATLGEFDLRKINNMVSHGAFIRILEGKVTDGEWKFRINKEEAWGEMNFRYEDLKVEFLDSLTLERGRGKLGLLTFLANTITKKSNPRKLFNRRVISDIYYERDESKFIFAGWWRATFSGIKGALGLGQAKMPKRKEEEE
ncbi:hypothetical protein PBT90_00115 [Algoriphagus halophytocola]|uniref:Translocation/assembly module TamB n=1 Tax=Algoriphagus halophytocola TaxID=2991499 RepID=A0ABY6MHG8_9BACT|nr:MULTISPECIES: hypothetical protein [unclassified Algoriphagus]UZD21862.1 hypothetical protein OM944_14440 [Algoriphagus sp. TR-M5]WBL43112.1 hypothetical protein PBT90_00115 [Algoriphagus sp. TR-M9]